MEIVCGWSMARRSEVIDVALQSRTRRDELLREFRSAPYVYDMVMDIGAYRDLHRHRRCQQFRQEYSSALGYETPAALVDAGLSEDYRVLMDSTFASARDFAEAEYICRLRSGVKGHFSYRGIAWQMKEKMAQIEPELGRLLQATPPWTEDPLQR
jgi:hypothetical protein